MRSVLVTGGTGFIGSALVRALVGRGDSVVVLTRNPARARALFPDRVNLVSVPEELSAIPDVLVNLAGEPLAGKRWSSASKIVFRDSRIGTTQALFTFFDVRGVFPARVINGSAIGYYGDCGDMLIDERAPVGADFAARLCRDWELSARQFEQQGSSLCLLRTGIVLGAHGGALKQMLPAFRPGLGGPMGGGGQFMSWIHIDDMVRLILFLIDHPAITGPVNAVSTQPVTNNDFSLALASALHRPAFLRMPGFVLRILFGEMADTLLLASQRVLPGQALGNGFEFLYPELDTAFENLLKK